MRRHDLLHDLSRDLSGDLTTVATPRRPWPSRRGARPAPPPARLRLWLVPLALLALGSLLAGVA